MPTSRARNGTSENLTYNSNEPDFYLETGLVYNRLACLLRLWTSAEINCVGGATIAAGGGRRSAAHAGRIIAVALRALTGSHLQSGSAAGAVTNLEVKRPEFFARDRVTGYP